MPPRREIRRGENARNVGFEPGQIAREVVAALAEANLLNQTLRANTSTRTFVILSEFCRWNPPKFDGNSSDHFMANHWLSGIRKIFNVLTITEDDIRVRLMACQLIGEVNEWWESILGARRDARRAAKVVDLDVEDLTWADFEEFFKNQYFPESYREQLREEFEQLEQGDMTVSEYAIKFQTLSRFAPELVATEERKYRRFGKGLKESIKWFIMSQRIRRYFEIVERARIIEDLEGKEKGAIEWEPREQVKSINSFLGNFWDSGRKRQREHIVSDKGKAIT